MDDRTCIRCHETKPATAFKSDAKCKRRTCKACDNAGGRARYSASEEVRRGFAIRNRRYKYGIETHEIEALYALQGGCCAVCGDELPADKFDVDHDHTTNEVRGLLHRRCNLVAGFLEDDDAFARVVAYLQDPPMRRLARKQAS